ncbi:MAG: hypothetical protein J6C81_01615 [Muribaculaceae bacterium]|nr:hypothetical protein [Muribaculaceae bacterium]
MKRTVFLIIILLSCLSAFAKAPNLNVEKLFDGRYNSNRHVTVSVYKNNGNYYRGLTIENDPAILKKIAETISKDAPRGFNYSDNINGGSRYISLKIKSNGETIFIGLQMENSGNGFFFIQGKEKAFK